MFTAGLALEYFHSGMRLPVLRETDVMTEGLSACSATVWPVASVGAPHVHLQAVWSAKYFLTSVARVRLVTVGLRMCQLVFMLRVALCLYVLLKMHVLAVECHFHFSF